MAQSSKISVRKLLQAFLTLVAAAACITAMVSASKLENGKLLDRVEVHIKSEKLYHFVEAKQIMDEAITNRNIDIMNIPVGRLDIQSMEKVLKEDPWVADAQIYVDNNRVLQILITERIPVARIFEQDGNSYYIDNTLNTMPLSEHFKYYTSVVTNAPFIANDSLGIWLKAQVVALVQAIRADTFWNAQVSQIIIAPDYTFQLIPVLGQQKIIFGDTSRMKEKFANIYAFYMKVLDRIGWDKYETLDVRYKGQVIASPSLPYKGPVDKAINEMNWINSIEQTEARKDSVLAITKAKTPALRKEKDEKQEKKGGMKEKDKPAAHQQEKPVANVANAKKDAKKDAKKENGGQKPGHETKAAVQPNNNVDNGGKSAKKIDKKNSDKKAAKYIYPDNTN